MAVRKKFGEILIEAGVLDEKSLKSALILQKLTGKRLGQVLEERRIITERDIAIVLGRQFGLKTVSQIADNQVSEEVLSCIDGDEALKKQIFPVRIEGRNLMLAMVNPLDMEVIDNLSFRTGYRVTPLVTTFREIQAAVSRHFFRELKVDIKGVWTVLLVDEQDGNRSALAAPLKQSGCQVLQVTSGREALNLILEHRPHLIVCSLPMDGMDAVDLITALLNNRATRKIPLIALSYKSTVEEESRLLEAGFFDFIAKPVHPQRLQIRVQRALQFCYGDRPPGA